MARGIHRFVIRLTRDGVQVRAQSKSLRGQSFTVGSVEVPTVGGGKSVRKVALRQAIKSFYPKQS